MRPLNVLAVCAAIAGCTGCATPPPPTATSAQTLAAVEAYRQCALDHMKPLRTATVGDSTAGIALMAEAACGQQREAIRAAVLLENAEHPQADAFAETYASAARRQILQGLTESMVQRR
jgi:hypothetical protein